MQRSNRIYVSSLATVLATAVTSLMPARAQIVSAPDANARVGNVNIIPLGGKSGFQSQNVRTQIRVPASYFPANGSVVRDVAFAAASKGSYSYRTFHVRLGHLPAVRNGKLSKTFADNLSGVVSVLDKSRFVYDLPAADAWHRIGATQTFKHDGKSDLVVDVVILDAFYNGTSPGSRRSSSLDTIYALGYDGKIKGSSFDALPYGAKLQFVLDNGSLVYVGAGCAASNKKTPFLKMDTPPALGFQTKAVLTDVEPKLATLLFFGVSDRSYGALTLPFKLDTLGAVGCTLRTDIVLIFAGVADAGGRTDFALSFPSDPRYAAQQVTMQGVVLDSAANSFGLVLSRLAKARL